MKRIITMLAVLTAVTAVSVPAALASEQIVWLDSRGDAGPGRVYMGPLTAESLIPGAYYIASAHGTMSYWRPSMWTPTRSRQVCGTPEDQPYYPGDVTGKVGLDAEVVFAQPVTNGSCDTVTVPKHHNYFQIDVGDGRGFRHIPPIGGNPTVAPDEHVHSYLLRPTASEIGFRLYDNQTAADNYGSLGIIVREAVPWDCIGFGSDLLGFPTLEQCTAAFDAIP
jgi:hypothetical protein